jgi:hypothetical protein
VKKRSIILAAMFAIAAPAAAAPGDGPGLTRVPYNSPHVPILACSTAYGCELILQPGEQLRLVSLMDDRWTAKVVDPGSGVTAPRILIAPTAADEQDPDGAGRRALRTSIHALSDRREYIIDLEATSRLEHHRLGFTYGDSPAVAIVTRSMTDQIHPVPEETAVALVDPQSETPPLDPSRMDFGWRQTGDSQLRCTGLFSYGYQLWCKLSVSEDRMPSAYGIDREHRLPLNVHTVAERYVVIDNPIASVELVIGGSHTYRAQITRAPE